MIQLPTQTLADKRKNDPRYKLAEILMQTPQNIRSPLEGIGQLAKVAAGTYKQNQLDKEYETKERNANDTLMGAMSAYGRSQQGGEMQTPKGAITWNKSTPEEADNMLIGALSKNSETSPMAMQMQMDQVANRRALAAELAGEQRDRAYKNEDFEKDAALQRELKGMENGGGPFSGNSMDAQSMNILLQGDPASPEYAAAYANQAAPKVLPNGMMITPDMSPFRAPATQPAPQGQAPQGQPKPTGTPTISPPTIMNESQSAAALYADRMANSAPIIDKTSAAGTDPWEAFKSSIPLLGNFIVSDDYRSLSQAQRDFVNATLRRESGAVISPSEFDNAKKQYFPTPGDDENTLSQKKANRDVALSGIMRSAGPAYQPPVVPDAPETQPQAAPQETPRQKLERLRAQKGR